MKSQNWTRLKTNMQPMKRTVNLPSNTFEFRAKYEDGPEATEYPARTREVGGRWKNFHSVSPTSASGIVIQTKFLCPTNFLGARIKATCFRGSITIGFDYSETETAHLKAIEACRLKFWPDMSQELVAFAPSPSNEGYCAIVTYPNVIY